MGAPFHIYCKGIDLQSPLGITVEVLGCPRRAGRVE